MNTTAAEVLQRELKSVERYIEQQSAAIASYAKDIDTASQALAKLTQRAYELRQALRPNVGAKRAAEDGPLERPVVPL